MFPFFYLILSLFLHLFILFTLLDSWIAISLLSLSCKTLILKNLLLNITLNVLIFVFDFLISLLFICFFGFFFPLFLFSLPLEKLMVFFIFVLTFILAYFSFIHALFGIELLQILLLPRLRFHWITQCISTFLLFALRFLLWFWFCSQKRIILLFGNGLSYIIHIIQLINIFPQFFLMLLNLFDCMRLWLRLLVQLAIFFLIFPFLEIHLEYFLKLLYLLCGEVVGVHGRLIIVVIKIIKAFFIFISIFHIIL